MQRLVLAAILLVTCVLSGTGARGAERPAAAAEEGAPLHQTFDVREFGIPVTAVAIVQDREGLIYVATASGVQQFDGVSWRLIRTSRRSPVHSLATDASGRVYVGGTGELGVLEPDAAGRLHYVSWLDRLPGEERTFAQVWSTLSTRNGVIFLAVDRIVRIGAKVRIWKTSSAFHSAYQVGDRVFATEAGRGLMELVDDEWKLVRGGERFAQEKIYGVLPLDNAGRLLIISRFAGMWLLDRDSFRRYPTDADAALSRDLVLTTTRLRDGSVAVGTIQGGLYILDPQGRLRKHVERSDGLPDEYVSALREDSQGGLWIGLYRGIARIQIDSPITTFSEGNGLEPTVLSIHRHAGTIFAGTDKGLARLEPMRGNTARFVTIPGIRYRTNAFLDWGPDLLVANAFGVYRIRDGKPTLVRPSPFEALALLRSRRNPDRVFVGLQYGMASMRWEGNHWVDEGPVPGVTEQVRSLIETPDGRLWAGTLVHGLLRLDFHPAIVGPPFIERFGTADGLPDLGGNSVWDLDGRPMFATHAGIYRFDESQRRFAPDPRFARLFPRARAVSSPARDSRGWLWMRTIDDEGGFAQAGAAVPAAGGVYRWERRPLQPLAASILSILTDPDGVVWLGGSDGLFRVDPGISAAHDAPFRALLRSVTGRDGNIYFGGAGAVAAPVLKSTESALRFEFASAQFDNVAGNTFQTKLDNVDRDWTPWTVEARRDFTNLREGSYTFRVRARNVYGAVSREAEYRFRVLPPWYRTWWAYAAMAILAAIAVYAIFRWRMRALMREKSNLQSMLDERRHAAEALQESEARYRSLFEQSPIGLYRARPDGTITAANPALLQKLGFTTVEDLAARNRQIDGQVPAAVRPEFRQRLERDGSVFGFESDWLTSTGLTLRVRESARLMRDADGKALYCEGAVEDVTAQRRAEEAQRRLVAAVEQAFETVLITDTTGLIEYVNPAFERTTGYPRSEVIGRTPAMLKSGSHDDAFFTTLWETITRGGIWRGHFVNRRKDGTLYEEDASIAPVRDAQGAIVNFVAVTRDVTELTSLARQLTQAQKMEAVGILAGGVAHDFNNFLQAMLATTQSMALEGHGTGNSDVQRAELEELIGRASQLTRQLLLFSRREDPRPEPLDLNDVVLSVRQLLRRLLRANITITVDIAAVPLPIRADRGQIEQVIVNLAVNAADAMPEGGTLSISTAPGDDGNHRLAVSDTGTGIPEPLLKKIFDPFFSTKDRGQGTGLGLAVVQTIVNSHGGQITVDSVPGSGSTFLIALPAAAHVVTAKARERLTETRSPGGHGERVLLVEDDDAVRRGITRLLKAIGYSVTDVASGEEAVAHAASDAPVDLLLTDQMLQGMSGIEVAREFQQLRPGIGIILMTGYAGDAYAQAQLPPTWHSLQKPVDVDVLARVVRAAMHPEDPGEQVNN